MTMKLQVTPRFPAQVLGGNGITVSKANGIYTITFNPSTASPLANPVFTGGVTLNGDVIVRHTITPTAHDDPGTNIAIGKGAGAGLVPISTTQYLTAVGFNAASALTTADHVTAIGAWALASGESATSNNTAVGIDSMRGVTTGSFNTCLGEHTIANATTVNQCVAVGTNAMLWAGGSANVAVGYQALGSGSGSPLSGNNNIAIGAAALGSIAGSTSLNVAVGGSALASVTTGGQNVAVGDHAGNSLLTGQLNTCIGYVAGFPLTTGSNNTIIGANAGSVTLTSGNDNILIGTYGNVADTPASNTSAYLNIGNLIKSTNITTAPATLLQGSLTVTGAWSATGNGVIGPGGTGTTPGLLNLNGGSGSGGGAVLQFSANAVPKIVIGAESAISGGTGQDFLIQTAGFGEAFRVNQTTGAISHNGSLTINSKFTVTAASGTVSTPGNAAFGPGDASAVPALINLNGGSGSGGGGLLKFSAASVIKTVIGAESAISGGTGQDFLIQTAGFGLAVRVNQTTGAVSLGAGLTALSGTAIPAGGTAGSGLMVSSTANFGVFFGSGAPSLSAAKGSLYLRSDGSTTNDRAYINTNGSTTWTALTTAA